MFSDQAQHILHIAQRNVLIGFKVGEKWTPQRKSSKKQKAKQQRQQLQQQRNTKNKRLKNEN